MTREEDIKARLVSSPATPWVNKNGNSLTKFFGRTASEDIRYLLARNEELQQKLSICIMERDDKVDEAGRLGDSEARLVERNEELQREKEKMQAVVEAAKDVIGEAADDLDDNKGKCSVSSYQIKDLEWVIKRLDAKEQDDV